MNSQWSNRATQIGEWYRNAALTTFSAIVLLLLLNLGLGVLYLARDTFSGEEPRVDSRVKDYRERHVDLEAYSKLSQDQANELLDDQAVFWSKGFLYAPWVQFRGPEFHSRWLNTDNYGHRLTRSPRSSDQNRLKVFLFGGSTTFGYGVADEHTIPSYLQTFLEEGDPATAVAVSNYAQAYYYSSQEMQAFFRLLKQGMVPNYAIFIDGLNDIGLRTQRVLGFDEPWFTPEMTALWDARRGSSQQADPALSQGRAESALLSRLPMVRFARSIASRVLPQSVPDVDKKPEPKESHPAVVDPERVAREVENITSVYLANMTMTQAVCQTYRIKCLFVWQPVPFYKYDAKLLRNPSSNIQPHWSRVFAGMSELRRDNFLYLGDMLENSSAKAYVDQVHYNERVNGEIAKAIYRFIRSNQKAKPVAPASAKH
jgi:hypothetical protein